MAATKAHSRTRTSIWHSVIEVSAAELGAYFALALALVYLLAALTFAFLPRPITDPLGVLLVAGYSAPGWYQSFFGELALIGLLGLGVVPNASRLVAGSAAAWLDWASRLGYLGFAVAAVQGVRLGTLVPDVARLYQGCGSCPINLADQQTLAKWLYTTLPLDPFYWIIFGAVGIWVLVISVAALNSASLPRLFSVAGIGLAASSWLIVIGGVASQTTVVVVGAVFAGVVFGPVWYGWMGVLLRAQRR